MEGIHSCEVANFFTQQANAKSECRARVGCDLRSRGLVIVMGMGMVMGNGTGLGNGTGW